MYERGNRRVLSGGEEVNVGRKHLHELLLLFLVGVVVLPGILRVNEWIQLLLWRHVHSQLDNYCTTTPIDKDWLCLQWTGDWESSSLSTGSSPQEGKEEDNNHWQVDDTQDSRRAWRRCSASTKRTSCSRQSELCDCRNWKSGCLDGSSEWLRCNSQRTHADSFVWIVFV